MSTISGFEFLAQFLYASAILVIWREGVPFSALIIGLFGESLPIFPALAEHVDTLEIKRGRVALLLFCRALCLFLQLH